ncbi:hypothetical protein [Synechococcus sp. RedBA-s]|uniref:hypothetical protein n=1 Tax=Synechococcus sp. RedBA-s TaxID=2823741 RepID=UPI0020CEF0A2|nr:hypothetical protein [Synechococcus sp. RedBA-s]MCP9800518.1 hypothetical protein [Synechococcus sp. RedBA-s]
MRRLPPLIPVLLVLLALGDLATELRLLADHFTWSSLMSAIQQHPLAVVVLLLTPSLIRHYR